MDISIIIPSIRKENLVSIYDSIASSTKRDFELIIIGPNNLPDELLKYKNIKNIRDFGPPIRAAQIGASLAEGKLFMTSADDAYFIKDHLDRNIDFLYSKGDNYKNIVISKYYEGVNGTEKPLQPDVYFTLNGSSWTKSPYIKDDWWIFNAAIMYRSFFEELGGWDCDFHTTLSQADLAVRCYYEGANVFMSDYPLLDCDHSQPDHSPIELSFGYHDAPTYANKYRNSNFNLKTKLNINNWRIAPRIWNRRF